MNYQTSVEFKGHIFDSLLIPKVLDTVLESGATCVIKQLEIAESKEDDSYARIKIKADSQETLDSIVSRLEEYGGQALNIISKRVEIKGHIIDSLTLPKILDTIVHNNGRCEIEKIDVGVQKTSLSYAKINIMTTNQEDMDVILEKVQKHGALII